MDTKIKNMFEVETTENRTEQLAPHPMKPDSRTAHLYDLLSSLGGKATLTEMWRMVPASDLAPKPKNKEELRRWLSSSGTSKGYITKIKKDYYRIATLEEYKTVFERNRATFRKYEAKKKRREARAAAKTAAKTATPAPAPNPVVKQPVVKQPVVEQSNTSSQFAREYLGALLGTSCAIVLFYVILKVLV